MFTLNNVPRKVVKYTMNILFGFGKDIENSILKNYLED